MSSTTLSRLSGISVFIGGLFAALATVPVFFTGEDPGSPIAATAALLRIIGDVLIVVGLPGVYSRQAQRAGLLGLIGFLSTLVYILITGVVNDTISAVILPFLASAAPHLLKGSPPQGLLILFLIGGLLGVVGSVSLGVAMLRAKTVERWVGLPLVVGVVLNLAGSFLFLAVGTAGSVLLLIGLAWLGFGGGRLDSPRASLSFQQCRSGLRCETQAWLSRALRQPDVASAGGIQTRQGMLAEHVARLSGK